jgi:hypothetical protein
VLESGSAWFLGDGGGGGGDDFGGDFSSISGDIGMIQTFGFPGQNNQTYSIHNGQIGHWQTNTITTTTEHVALAVGTVGQDINGFSWSAAADVAETIDDFAT